MAALRFLPFLRTPSLSLITVSRVIRSDTSSRFLCSEPVWRFQTLVCRNRYEHSSRHVYQQCHSIGASQLARFMSQKIKDEQFTDHKETKQEPSKSSSEEASDDLEQFQKLSTYAKIKAMYRDYWYVLVPVHVASSIVFFGIFYYTASSGVDIVAIMEKLHIGESVISTVRDSNAGFIAIAYALYKIFTPIRYTVTLGGTTWAIRFLRERGLIKPRRPMKEAKENMQNIISAMKMPEKDRQKFLEEKGMPRIGKAVGQASSAVSNLSNKAKDRK